MSPIPKAKLWSARERRSLEPTAGIRGGPKNIWWLTPTEDVAARTLHTLVCRYKAGERGPLHRHNMEEVFYIISGRGYAVVEGCHYELEAGDVLFVDANIKHCTGAADEPMDFFVACGVYQTPFKNDWVEEFADE